MTSREKILAAVKQNQPEPMELPDIAFLKGDPEGVIEKYSTTLTNVGGKVYRVAGYEEIAKIVKEIYKPEDRILTLVPELAGITNEAFQPSLTAHHWENVELAVIRGHFGVAENGAVWVTEELMGHRALPFITQYLAIVIKAEDIVPTMHEAYIRTADKTSYGYGVFIAGPSKTADIEQSLVIGAHGPRGMTVFILD
ncbi:L-lactate dehydrogenase complex protein LldG [Mucilaginibacter yixingensis]|uniref:L-lactate dehydrogenase complex protein LldG n=1 Tax=Mucilaginibacter yixingensis TaxID=1295612 RepID=A0A2T5JFA2_9SPHI|nr:LUD domain-containing protein [Mucilaginibacter yixingensis]PTR01099.1 L-lactate dehydrogenase complex protein LldG [Mucilaginibacter yixingensis]